MNVRTWKRNARASADPPRDTRDPCIERASPVTLEVSLDPSIAFTGVGDV